MNRFSFLNSKYTKFLFAILLGVICLYYVANSFNWKQIGESLQQADLAYFFAGAFLTLPTFLFFRTARWYALLKSENLNLPFFRVYLYSSISIGISNITPFQSGEAVKVEFLRKYGVGRPVGYTIFFLEKILDFAFIITMGVLSVSFGFDSGVPLIYFYILAGILILGFFVAFAIGFYLPFERLNPVKDLVRQRWRQKRSLLAAIFFTGCSWSAAIVGWKMTLASVSVDISLLQTISLVSLSVLLALISFVPGAVGVSELGITAILTRMGTEQLAAQTGSIALRAYALLLLVLAFLHWVVLKCLPKETD